MYELFIPISEFLSRAVRATDSSDYLAFMTIIARSADGQFLQDELLRQWESFDDLTGGQILVLSPKSRDEGEGAAVHHSREPSGFVNRTLQFGRRPSQEWESAFWEAYPLSKHDVHEVYEAYGGAYSPDRPSDEPAKKAAITASATEAARFFGLGESSIPCVVVLSLADRKAIVVTADQRFSLYSTVRATLIEYEPVVIARENCKKQCAELANQIRLKEQEIGKSQSVDRTSAHIASSWKEQIEASVRLLSAVKGLRSDSREFADLLVRWLTDEIGKPADFDSRWGSWFSSITDPNRSDIPKYLVHRIEGRLPRTIERKSSGYLSEVTATLNSQQEKKMTLRAQIMKLEQEQSNLLKSVDELKRNHPLSKSFIDVLAREHYVEDSVKVEPFGVLSGWTFHHLIKSAATTSAQSVTKYDVAMSFAGEDRPMARDLATGLQSRGVTVFYDEFEKAQLWGRNLNDYLTTIYSEGARFCMVLISEAYVRKLWTSVERQAMQAGALLSNVEAILPVRLDDAKVPGFLPTVAYYDLRREGISAIVEAAVARVQGRSAPR